VMLWLLTALQIAAAEPVRHALVVGADEGGGVLEKLQYAERDAEKMAEVLVELGSFDDELVTVLYAPTPEVLRAALAHHAAVAETYEDDLFLFYYSGHADASGLRLGDDRYFYEALKHDFRAVDSDVRVGVLDACRSGTITRLKGAAVTESLFGQQVAAEGEAWLTASAADELAQESDQLRGGFFTHYLISGMRGAADHDDGVVELGELYDYTRDRVVASTGATAAGTQHPHFDYRLSGSGPVALTDVRNADALIVVPEGIDGQIAILKLPDRTQLAELAKRSDKQQAIAVPGGRYLVRRRSDDKLYEVGVSVNDGAKITVENWGAAQLEYATARGDSERIGAFIAESEAYERKLNLGAHPVVAASASLVIPGAGQLYNGQVWKGLGYFAGVSALVSTSVLGAADQPLSGFWPMFGVTLWGASMADAAYNVHRREERRPRMGGQLSFGTSYGGQVVPQHIGLSGDVMLREGVSIGLDKVGYSPGPDGSFDLGGGPRLMLASEGEDWRPGVYVGLGIRHGRLPDDERRFTRTVFTAGANLRAYVVTRYFIEGDVRYERDGLGGAVVGGLGMGIHLGR